MNFLCVDSVKIPVMFEETQHEARYVFLWVLDCNKLPEPLRGAFRTMARKEYRITNDTTEAAMIISEGEIIEAGIMKKTFPPNSPLYIKISPGAIRYENDPFIYNFFSLN